MDRMDRSRDRRLKYAWGSVRLALLTVWSFTFSAAARAGWHDYTIGRLLSHVFVGSIGAVVNVSILPLQLNMALLIAAGALMLWDLGRYGLLLGDHSIAVYLIKTMGGDFISGKLDSLEWRLVLVFAFAVLLPAAWYFGGSLEAWGPITLALFVVQLFCEFGDAHLEHYSFFRWRYSFELCTLLLLLLVPWRPHELRVIHVDLVACLSYRLANYLLILAPIVSPGQIVNHLLFRLLGWYTGTPIVHVTSPAVVTAVLKASSCKGKALEALIACPAWLPILSLESVDGELWKSMRLDFDALMKLLPPPEKLQEITSLKTRAMLALGTPIDAAAIARLTLETFISYVFEGRAWTDDFELFLKAAAEWRGEISVRRRADKTIQHRAVTLLVDGLIRPSKLWSLFGERWAQPEHFSLIMQPFIISPVINVGDIMCAAALEARKLGSLEKVTLDACLRQWHPFPILERFVHEDVLVGGSVAVRAGSQCLVFTQDLRGSAAWPVFGAGPRACAGMHLAMPFLKVLMADLCSAEVEQRFCPLSGHEQSGRHHDGQLGSAGEAWYFVKTVAKALAAARRSGGGGGVQQCPMKLE